MKIVFTGPESSGKTTLATWASEYYGFNLVNEVAREYLVNIGLGYHEHHVREIGRLQSSAEKNIHNKGKAIICDTDLLNIIIWQQEKYGRFDVDFYKEWQTSNVDLFFLCTPDIPWEADSLRENPTDRDRLFEIYTTQLVSNEKSFIILSGTLENRQSQIKKNIEYLLG